MPIAVVATVGTTSSTSIDPVDAIADVCREAGVWLHVDAAYAGVMAMLPAWRHILAGAERADSLVVNPHKWLFTPFDLSAFYCRRMDVVRAGVLAGGRVPQDDRGGVGAEPDGHRRAARSPLPRAEAVDGAALLRRGGPARRGSRSTCRLARLFASWVDGEHRLRARRRRAVQRRLLPLRSRRAETDETALDRLNERLLESVNASGEIFVSHTKLDGRYVIRLAVGNLRTTEAHVARAWALFNEHAARIEASAR